MFPETDNQNHRETDNRKHCRDGQMARHGEGMDAGDDAEGHHAHEVGHQDEHEQREHQRHVFLAFWAHTRRQHIVYKSGHAFDCHLPAAWDQFTLHAAPHEQPEGAEHNHHKQRRVGEGDVVATNTERRERLNLELVHRIDFAAFACHVHYPVYARQAPGLFRTLVRDLYDISEGDCDAQKHADQQKRRGSAKKLVE